MRRRTALRALLAVPAGAVAGSALLGGPAHAAVATIDPRSNWGTWEGWGTSLAWWAKAFGHDTTMADLFFTRNQVRYRGEDLPGLGLNIVRYNAGACTDRPIGSRPAPGIGGFKQIEGYQLDWYSADPSSASWNWYADSFQRDMMWLARDRGANTFELFSNSPMWWMTRNDDPFGAVDGGENLQDQNYGRHAAYLATIARYAHDHWGVDFTSVQPVNEPDGAWGGSWGHGQEGCHFERGSQARLVNELRTQLDQRDLWWMKVAGMDAWGYDDARATFGSFDAGTRAKVGRINTHGYQGLGGRRDLLYGAAQAAGKGIWNTEYGDGDGSGMTMSDVINCDLRWLHPTGWVYWQVVDGWWGMVGIDGFGQPGMTPGAVATKYFVMAQYSRHIRPGMRILDSGDPNTVAAYDAARRTLVIVATNHGAGQWLDYDLSRFTRPGSDGALVGRWCTNTDGGDRYTYHADTTLHGSRFWSWFDPRTVQTFEVSNVDL
ncbi:glycoside hydrolase [Longispora sp. K20-0274]|uniref:glycoside hydrolase n=1 Tax=Longispora sp. K20-0274 TaxID=3088255 RepID=UPI003999D931